MPEYGLTPLRSCHYKKAVYLIKDYAPVIHEPSAEIGRYEIFHKNKIAG
jgi:hypothetical protein